MTMITAMTVMVTMTTMMKMVTMTITTMVMKRRRSDDDRTRDDRGSDCRRERVMSMNYAMASVPFADR